MSAEEPEKTITAAAAAETPAGDEEEEWLYGGETSSYKYFTVSAQV